MRRRTRSQPSRGTWRIVLPMVLLAGALPILAGAQEQAAAPLDLAKWVIDDPEAAVEEYLGRRSLLLDNGTALLRDVAFENGTIEVEIASTSAMVFAGVAFRAQSPEESEIVYLRLHRSGEWDALQYTPRHHGLDAWQLYSGEGFTAAAKIPGTEWFSLKVVFEGEQARVHLGGAEEPSLTVRRLKRDAAVGAVGLWGRFGARFSNFRYTPAADSPSPRPAPADASPEEPAPGVLRHWRISPAFDAGAIDVESYPEAGAITSWETVESEPSGLVNLARNRTKAGRLSVVYAKAVITSDRDQVRKLSFGYSDQVHVFLNGRILFSANGTWRSRYPSSLGIVGDQDHLYLDLKKGENEILLAVTELFGGWGFLARLDAVEGVSLVEPP